MNISSEILSSPFFEKENILFCKIWQKSLLIIMLGQYALQIYFNVRNWPMSNTKNLGSILSRQVLA